VSEESNLGVGNQGPVLTKLFLVLSFPQWEAQDLNGL